ncbi:hypothetical protein CsSME_00014047 [Camellia sinensis var. sinensis]
MPPPTSMRTADSLPVEVIIQFMMGLDIDFFRAEGNYVMFIQTHLMPPLIGVRAGEAVGAPVAGEAT